MDLAVAPVAADQWAAADAAPAIVPSGAPATAERSSCNLGEAVAPRCLGRSVPDAEPDCEIPGAIRCEEHFFPDAALRCDTADAIRCAEAWDFRGVLVGEVERIVPARDHVAQAAELPPAAASR